MKIEIRTVVNEVLSAGKTAYTAIAEIG